MENKTKYLKIYTIISAILSLIYILIFCIVGYKNMNAVEYLTVILLCIIPFISSFLILLIGKRTNEKHPKITKIAANIVNLLILIIHGVFMLMVLLLVWSFSDLDTEYTKIEDYTKALNSYTSNATQHFPNRIPENAQNISMYRSPSSFTGDSDFHLKFDADTRYIQSEKDYFKNKQLQNVSDYTKERANSVLDYLVKDDDKGWDLKILESSSCFRGVAFKNNTVMYILYCD